MRSSIKPTDMNSEDRAAQLRKKRSRPYSRRGCQRCKRMKVKCDEQLPKCTRCARSNATCEYPEPDVRLQPMSEPMMNALLDMGVSKIQVSPGEESNESMDKGLLELLDDDLSLQMDQAIQQDIQNSFRPTPLPSTILRLQVDLKLLRPIYRLPQDMNDPLSPPTSLLSTDTIYHFPEDCFQSLDIDPQHKRYLDLFSTEFSEILMPLRASYQTNTIRDVLLQYSVRKDYLYYAVLSSGARLSYKKTKLLEDEQYFSRFLLKTSEMLSDYKYIQTHCSHATAEQFTQQTSKIVSEVLEPLLLTILLLTSDNASSMKHSWRGHLRGAKELLQRVFVDHFFPVTKILVFCKAWFTLFEILAGLSAPYGGTLVHGTAFELNRLSQILTWNVHEGPEADALKELKMITDDGFVFIFGCHHGLLGLLVRLIEYIRSSDPPISTQIISLLGEFQKFKDFHVAQSPEYTQETIDWCECIHQSMVDAAMITILTQFLKVTSTPADINPVIQELVHSILYRTRMLLSKALTPPQNEESQVKLMMNQWPLLTAGLHTVKQEDRAVVQGMFEHLTGLGSGSAKYALQKIRRAWSRSAGVVSKNESEGPEEVDIVTY